MIVRSSRVTKFETNQIDVMGDGKVILYQRPDHKVQKWQARISVDGASGYKRFSIFEEMLLEVNIKNISEL